MISRILIESDFSIERRVLARHSIEAPSQPDFLIVHFIESRIPNIPSGASLLANQVGSGLGTLAVEVLSVSDIGVPATANCWWFGLLRRCWSKRRRGCGLIALG